MCNQRHGGVAISGYSCGGIEDFYTECLERAIGIAKQSIILIDTRINWFIMSFMCYALMDSNVVISTT